MNEINIKTEKTARIYLSNSLTNKTKEVVIAFHGYAQLAQYFIKKFEVISNEERTIVAPEGLSKFYWNGMNGRVVASWMTKEDRLSEIEDQKVYLDKVLALILDKNPNIKISLFGFSQGCATLYRWIASRNFNINRIILWAGFIPNDVMDEVVFKTNRVEIAIGNEDEFIPEENIESGIKLLNEKKINHELIIFDGGHIIKETILSNLFN